MNHKPWQPAPLYGLSVTLGQKTIKTECGKRVPMAAAKPHPEPVTCPACLAKIAEWRAACESLGITYREDG